MPVFLFLLMLGLGATLSADNFHQILRQPKPLLIGLASQYGWMPLIALTLVLALNLPPAISVGLIIVSCTSGGPLSNFFTYISRADLALSIAMTVASTVCGLVMIPLLLLIYTAPLVDTGGGSNLAIPYGKIIATLIVILVPVGFGIFLRSRNPLWAARVERGGSVAGFIIVILVVASLRFDRPRTLLRAQEARHPGSIDPDRLPLSVGRGPGRWVVACSPLTYSDAASGHSVT